MLITSTGVIVVYSGAGFVARKTDDYPNLLFNNSSSKTGLLSKLPQLGFAMPPRKKAVNPSPSLLASPSPSTSAVERLPVPATRSSLRQRRSQNTNAGGKDNVEFNVKLKKNVNISIL